MLITTHTGLVVHSDHVAYIALRKQRAGERESAEAGVPAPRFKTLLCLATGERIVACAGLTRTAAVFLRQDITQRWTEDAPSFDVNASLQRHREGAYFAVEAPEPAERERG